MEEPPPRVLLGDLAPIILLGLQRVLSEQGVDVVGHQAHPEQLLAEARRLQPDAVVLDLTDGARRLGERVQRVSRLTKVILWARDETVMEVLDPAHADPRLVLLTSADELSGELSRSRSTSRVED